MPEQGGISGAWELESEELEEKTENFFSSLIEPQSEHFASPSQSLDLTRSSESAEQSRQVNS